MPVLDFLSSCAYFDWTQKDTKIFLVNFCAFCGDFYSILVAVASRVVIPQIPIWVGFSPCTLLVPQGIDGIEFARSARGVKAKKYTHRGGKKHRNQCGGK